MLVFITSSINPPPQKKKKERGRSQDTCKSGKDTRHIEQKITIKKHEREKKIIQK